ncbi:MAG TPA: ABC transporter permease, partial [Cyclobacteriaceae bacterium]|nr:ABC transporter permease [Cyclobacteriaceae bacterium]
MIEYVIKLKRKTKNLFQDGWVWTMAWRDARQNFSRLLLFAASLVTGIAAVVAISSLNDSLKDAIDQNAKELLGADLVVESNRTFEKEVIAAFDSTKMEQSSQTTTTSMVMFMNNGQSRLVQVLGFQGNFPYYGKIVTQPEDA